MDFRRGIRRDEPEINFIPLIDLLLVILIFLMVTTTYSRFTELQVNLPTAGAEQAAERPAEIIVAVSADARYLIDNKPLSFGSAASFGQALQQAAAGRPDVTLVINADAGASHQSVVNVLEAARLAGLAKVTFAAQSPASGAR
ncbi:MAG: biopolymer transporter ExbD [Pseudomonadales bacterium]|nr:biopolymer transporter ExbD [Burkholderiaceae bacterium]MBP6482783.1 biopolymer transporter ExbD [Pseudomonadales bacterium]MBP6816653.1 biopolymer transporter ExbD [Burkholderiaceae bacterium]